MISFEELNLQPFNQEDDGGVDDQESYLKARAQAVAYIGISHKSSGRVQQYLMSKGYERPVAEKVIAYLVEAGYVDDFRVGCGILRQRRGAKAEAPKLLKQRLRQAGIAESVIAEVLETEPLSEELLLEELVQARLAPSLDRFLADLDFEENTEATERIVQEWFPKALRFLGTKGFSISLAQKALHKLLAEVE